MAVRATLPDLKTLDVAALRTFILSQHEQILLQREQLASKDEQLVRKDEQLASREAEIERLKLLIAKLRRMQFGRRSEKLERQIERLELRLEDLQTKQAENAAPIPARTFSSAAPTAQPIRRPLPEHLPRETHRHDPREQTCPDCGGELKVLGEDVSEVLEYVPAQFKVIRHVRPKLSCARCDKIVQAEATSRPIARGMAGPGLLAHVLVSKYADHLPLYRQAEIYARWHRTGTLDAGRLGRLGKRVAGTAGRGPASSRDERSQAARRRYAGTGVGSGKRQDEDRAVVEVRS